VTFITNVYCLCEDLDPEADETDECIHKMFTNLDLGVVLLNAVRDTYPGREFYLTQHQVTVLPPKEKPLG
jgi:hypothetical protein